jgi:hypothetical protein
MNQEKYSQVIDGTGLATSVLIHFGRKKEGESHESGQLLRGAFFVFCSSHSKEELGNKEKLAS